MFHIDTIEKFCQFLNSIENVSVKIDDLQCDIYISNSIVARGKAISNDVNEYEIEELLKHNEHTQIEQFFYIKNKIFSSDSKNKLIFPSGNISEFIGYLFNKYPDIEPIEYLIQKQSNELNNTIIQLNSIVLQLRIENNKINEDLLKVNSELYESNRVNKQLEEKIAELLRTAAKKEKLIIPTAQYFVKELNCISLDQYNSICNYENKHHEGMNNKTVCVYEKDSIVSLSFNPSIYNEYLGLDLVGIVFPLTVSSEKTLILFDKKGECIENLKIETLKKIFELDWDVFKKIELIGR